MRVLSAALVVALAACSSAPQKPAPEKAPSAEKRPGGYYQNDGPGAKPPPLASIPDAAPRVEPLNRFANRPYNRFGKDYVPLTSVQPYKERGMASWYGRQFHGQKTSSGEVYDMYAMTAAHPRLPIPSYARVTNLSNRKSVVVRVNDRGPRRKDRILDVSYRAAKRLGFSGAGLARVRIEPL